MIHPNNKNKIEYIKGNYGKIISLKRNTNNANNDKYNNNNENNKYNTDNNNHNIDENHHNDHPPREKRIVKINKEKKKAPPDIDEQFEKIYQEIKPFEDDNEKKQKIHFKIQNIVDSVYKDAVLHPFGSSVNQFNLRNSDLDMVLILPKEYNSIPHSEIVQTLADKFTELNYEGVICYPQARVPIVKFVDNETKIDVDICIDNKLAIASSQLLATYSKIDERVIKLSHMVKYWAKKRNINSPFRGTLGSYGYVLMVISFFQQTTPPILPVLQQIDNKKSDKFEENIIDGNDCSYDKSFENFETLNKETVGNLLFQFFEYFFRFDYFTNAISVRLGKNIRKIDHKWNKNQFKRDFFFLVIEDPFNTGSSVGSNIYMQGFQKIVHELQRAMELLHQNKGLESVVSSEFNEF